MKLAILGFLASGAMLAAAGGIFVAKAVASDEAQEPTVTVEGEPGEPGEPGEEGPQGEPGDTVTGPEGSEGDPGAAIVGPRGPKGEKGERGKRGPRGDRGKHGRRGPQGPPGESASEDCGQAGGTMQDVVLNSPGGQLTLRVCVLG